MEENKKIYTQLKHCFYLHSEYIHFDEIFEDAETEGEEIDYEEFKQWVEDEKEGINDENVKLDSELYPLLKDYKTLINQIELLYPNFSCKIFEQIPIQGKSINVFVGSVYTQNGLLEFFITVEDDKVFHPIRVEVSLSDYPYFEVRKMAKTFNCYLFHLNSLEYMDVDDDNEVGTDLISPNH